MGASWFSLSEVSHSSRAQSVQSSVRTRYRLCWVGVNLCLPAALSLSAAGAFPGSVDTPGGGNAPACLMNCRTRNSGPVLAATFFDFMSATR